MLSRAGQYVGIYRTGAISQKYDGTEFQDDQNIALKSHTCCKIFKVDRLK